MQFVRAETLDSALDALATHGEGAKILAGGTDLMVQLARAEVKATTLIHIESLRPELAGIGFEGERLRIGGMATHHELARNAILLSKYPSLAYAASTIGGWQTQSIGTIGGNICNASPAADTLPPLLSHGATVELISRERGVRTVPLSEFLRGRRATDLQSDELLVAVTLDPVPPRTADCYLKVGRRRAMEVAIAGLALRCTLEADLETISDVRIATCAVGPFPKRVSEAEGVLLGSRLSPETISEAGAALRAHASPIDDTRSTAAYRLAVLPRLLVKGLRDCMSKISKSQEQEGSGL